MNIYNSIHYREAGGMETVTTPIWMDGIWVDRIVVSLMESIGTPGAATIIRCAAPWWDSDQWATITHLTAPQ